MSDQPPAKDTYGECVLCGRTTDLAIKTWPGGGVCPACFDMMTGGPEDDDNA